MEMTNRCEGDVVGRVRIVHDSGIDCIVMVVVVVVVVVLLYSVA